MDSNDQKTTPKGLYPERWVYIQISIEQMADLDILNDAMWNKCEISESSLSKKRKAREKVQGNITKLEIFFGSDANRSEEFIQMGRRMYRQYKDVRDKLDAQASMIEDWLSCKATLV